MAARYPRSADVSWYKAKCRRSSYCFVLFFVNYTALKWLFPHNLVRVCGSQSQKMPSEIRRVGCFTRPSLSRSVSQFWLQQSATHVNGANRTALGVSRRHQKLCGPLCSEITFQPLCLLYPKRELHPKLYRLLHTYNSPFVLWHIFKSMSCLTTLLAEKASYARLLRYQSHLAQHCPFVPRVTVKASALFLSRWKSTMVEFTHLILPMQLITSRIANHNTRLLLNLLKKVVNAYGEISSITLLWHAFFCRHK